MFDYTLPIYFMILYNTMGMSHLKFIHNKWSWDICWSNCTLNQLQDTGPFFKSLHFLRRSINSLLLCNQNVLHLFMTIHHLNLSWSSSVHSALSHPCTPYMQFSLYGDLHYSVSLMLRSTHPRHYIAEATNLCMVVPSFLEHVWISALMNVCSKLHTHCLAFHPESSEQNLCPWVV